MATKTPQSPVDEASVRENLKKLDEQVNALIPHLNKAHQAFGGLEDQQAQLLDLRNKIAQARAVYGA